MPEIIAIFGRNDCVFGVGGRHNSVSICGPPGRLLLLPVFLYCAVMCVRAPTKA